LIQKTHLEGDGSKYQQVKTNIKNWILAGEVDAEGKIPSENTLSELFDVSRHTIRQAIGELVNEGWLHRERGKGTFVAVAQTPQKGPQTHYNIGVVTTYLVDYIFPHIVQGIESIVVSQGHALSLYSTGNNVATERRALEMALQQGVDGLIIEPTKSTHPNPNIDLYLLMEQKNIPFVMLHSSYVELNASVVQLDDARGSYLATSHLFDIGHRKLGAIFKSDDAQGRARFRGFVKAHQDYRVPIEGQLIRTYTTEDKQHVVTQYVADFVKSLDTRPTGVVCYNDEIAIELIGQLRAMGIDVPKDLSVTGFDDSSLANNGFVQLTTVRHPKREMGEVAAEMLLDLLANKENMWVPREHVFEPALIVRGSTKQI
jgi:GntR family transcriptional regulator, arabinose operon transcriptional repressor